MKKLLFVFMLGIALSACSGTSTKNSTPVQDSVKVPYTSMSWEKFYNLL